MALIELVIKQEGPRVPIARRTQGEGAAVGSPDARKIGEVDPFVSAGPLGIGFDQALYDRCQSELALQGRSA